MNPPLSKSTAHQDTWESLISTNPPDEEFTTLGPAKDYVEGDSHSTNWRAENLSLAEALERDQFPLPIHSDREGYYGPHHFSYWASGLRDMRNLLQCAQHHSLVVSTYLDVGCASGRVIRHFAINSNLKRVIGCDINRRHIEWILEHLPDNIEVFQNTSIPLLPIADSTVDLISAFSVFTHIENFDLAWIMEFKRILRPGGLAWITFCSEHYWTDMNESWTICQSWFRHPEFVARRRKMNEKFNRLVFRRRDDRSYTSIVFYDTDYLCKRWGRVLKVLEIRRRFPTLQDVIILQKPYLHETTSESVRSIGSP